MLTSTSTQVSFCHSIGSLGGMTARHKIIENSCCGGKKAAQELTIIFSGVMFSSSTFMMDR